MARREVTGRRPFHGLPVLDPQQPLLALTIPQFCKAFSISEAFYYKLKKLGQGPREMEVGARKMITILAADQWSRECEQRVPEVAHQAETQSADAKVHTRRGVRRHAGKRTR